MRISFAIESDVIAGRLISEASRLKCDPRQLGVALVTVVLDAMLVDNVLDGDDPKRFAQHYGQMRVRTPLEDRIDEVFLFVAQAIHERHNGRVALGVRDIARGIGSQSGVVARAIKHLVTGGRLKAERVGHREKTIYSLPKREVQ